MNSYPNMVDILLILLTIAVLSLIKIPTYNNSTSEKLSPAERRRRRQLRRAARRGRECNKGGLPWFGNGKR